MPYKKKKKKWKKIIKMTYSRHDDAFDVSEDSVPIFAQLGRLLRQQVANIARLDIRENAPLADVLQVVGDVVHHFFAFDFQREGGRGQMIYKF